MEVDQIQYKHQSSTNGNVGRITSTKILSQNQKMDYHYPDDEEEEQEQEEEEEEKGHEHKTGAPDAAAYGRFYGWPSSRIVRVSRASGGKDRHSKVLTSKGLRDRRVRLSVNTAIQFYDLQDRLGYDQPSKAVEWLLKAAASSIEELPPMNPPFPDTPKQIMSDEKRSSITAGSDGAAADPSSTSETSKGSSRSETRVKARERAKGRTLAEKENKEKENESSHNPSSFNAINRTSSFTELLNGGMNSRQWFSPPMDYFTNGFSPPLATAGGDHSSELHHFSFGPDNYGSSNGSGEYNLNFSISSANSAGVFAGYNRGTLQSNFSPSPSLLRFSSPPDGSHQNFFMGGASGAEVENHHQFLSGFYNQKGKGQN